MHLVGVAPLEFAAHLRITWFISSLTTAFGCDSSPMLTAELVGSSAC